MGGSYIFWKLKHTETAENLDHDSAMFCEIVYEIWTCRSFSQGNQDLLHCFYFYWRVTAYKADLTIVLQGVPENPPLIDIHK